jgi:hypothetical protein
MTTKPKTADELAAEEAEAMFKSGGRSGQAGQPILAPAAQAAPEPGERQAAPEPTADDLAKAGAAGGMPTSTAAATGGFTGKAGGKVLDKSDDEDEDDKKDKDEDEDDAEKGGTVGADDLMKSLDALDAAAEGLEAAEPDRRSELAKSLEDGTLNEDERAELMTMLAPAAPAPADDAIAKGGDDDDDVSKGFDDVLAEEFSEDYDISPFLDKFGHAVGGAMDIMREDLAKSANDQQRFNRALSKSFRGVGMIIKSQQEIIKSITAQNEAISHRLGIVEQQPAPRKSLANPGQAKSLQKSFADSDPGDNINREQIFKGLHLLMSKYKDVGGRAKNGEPIDRAVSSYELSGNITKSMLAEVKEALGGAQ